MSVTKMPSSKTNVTAIKAPEKTAKKKDSSLIKVKNASNKTLHLAGGPIGAGEKGEASQAEVALFHASLEKC